jgi:hypothetical protein
MRYLNLTGSQLKAFTGLKTTEEMQNHGPLALHEQVITHTHKDDALYLVSEGVAVCETDDPASAEILAMGRPHNAVLVEKGDPHGWLALAANTIIEHVFGGNVRQVLAAA